MSLELSFAIMFGVVLTAFFVGRTLGAAAKSGQIKLLRREGERVEASIDRYKNIADDLKRRLTVVERRARELEHSLVELPDIAQRLSSARNLREIPDCALDLIEELFAPRFSVFYKSSQGGLVVVTSRGQTPLKVGDRIQAGKGVVGWTAVRQQPTTPEDSHFDDPDVAGDPLLASEAAGFSLCLPVVHGRKTLGVILIGPSERQLPHDRELGRTIALLAGVTITHTLVLREQETLAKTDGLTGLLNRAHTLKTVDSMMTSDRGPSVLSLFLFDVDHFKHYNDSNGHLAGDDLLKSLSELLKRGVREGELVGRYGGEEFLLVMPGVGKDDSLRAAERFRALIAEHEFPFQGNQPLGNVTVSGGVATWPADGDAVATILQRADEALYRAKDSGRDCVLAFSPSMTARDADKGAA